MKNSSGPDWSDDEEDLVGELDNILQSLKQQDLPKVLHDEIAKEDHEDVHRLINRINELDGDTEDDFDSK